MPSLSLSLSLSHTNIHSRPHALSISLFLSLSLVLSLSISLCLSHSSTHTLISHVLRYCRSTGLHLLNTLGIIPILEVSTSPHLFHSTTTYYRSTRHLRAIPLLQVTMSPPRHISYCLLPPTTGLQVNTSSKPPEPSESYQSRRSPCPHLTTSLILYYYLSRVHRSTLRQNPQNHTITTGHHVPTSPYILLYYYLLQVYRSTRRQNPQNHTITTGHHVPTSPYISFSTNTYHRSTGQHVVKTLRSISLLQVTMSPPRHISHFLLLPTTCLQVNTSSKPSESYHYYRSPCPHLTISYSQLNPTTGPQVNTSSKPQESYYTTGQHVPTSPHISFSTTTYYRSTGQHVLKTLRSIPIPQVTMSPPRHISYSLLLPTTGLQVNTLSKSSESIHYYRSPCHHLNISHSLLLPTTGPQVNTSSKP